tara:strand:+ start:2217 stop:2447 length:231 start_codon:yes stop_codon:yes gene_type:complete
VILGTRNGAKLSTKGNKAIRLKANSHAENVSAIIAQIKASGAETYQQIATALNARGIPTARNSDWHPETVRRILNR